MTIAAYRNSLDLAREIDLPRGHFRNDGIADATFMLLYGAGSGPDLRFEPA
jgi:hypothetical protein